MPQQTAGLAKRLAEAADSYRDGQYYYFVCLLNPTSDHPDYDVHTASGSTNDFASSSADDLLNQLGSNYQKFGPFKTDTGDPAFLDFDSLQINLIKNNTVATTITIDNCHVDAIVLSLSAFDKFFLPYYTRLYGTSVASDFRSQAITALVSKKPPTHGDGTAYSTNASVQESVQS